MVLIKLALLTVIVSPNNCYENICRRQTTFVSQSSTFEKQVASHGNDGILSTHFGSCAITLPNQTKAWFQVDLGKQFSINSIKIYYRREYTWKQYRFRQFYLDTSNLSANQTTTAKRSRCYTDNTTAPDLPPNIIDIPCKQTARYVIVETVYDAPEDDPYKGAILEICEIEVRGCPRRHFLIRGYILNEYSSTIYNCRRMAFVYTDGTGIKLKRCEAYRYGPDCSGKCSVTCSLKICDINTGFCTKGCKTGFFGESCKNVCSGYPLECNQNTGKYDYCPAGRFGTSCEKTCNQSCYYDCDKNTGICTSCKDGRFGQLCDLNCSVGCISKCGRYNGSCACKHGWTGDACTCLDTHVQNTDADSTFAIYGTTAIVCLTVITVAVSLLLWSKCKRSESQGTEQQMSELPTVNDYAPPIDVDTTMCYQQLEHTSYASIYE